jgi:2-phosphoglycerate kinase
METDDHATSDSSSIFVSQEEGGRLPFSKGILSQSLLATAIDPSEAFEIAHQIEHELRMQRRAEIDRPDLRKLAHDVILAKAGEKAAQRYLLWRHHQEPDRPLIVLLGGTSGVGKSSIALEVARRLGIGRAVSTDSIRQMMRLMLSPELVPAIHGSSYDAWTRLPPIGERMPTVLEGFQAQAAAVSVGVRAMLERAIEESSHLVIDGVSIVPGLTGARAFSGQAHVICLMIASLDESELRARFVGRASGQSRRPADRYLENLDGILEIQRHLIAVAHEQGVPVIDNRRFDDSVRAVLDRVMEHLEREARVEPIPTGLA